MARTRTGFSLIEILVVLAIMGLGAAVIMPSTARMLDQTTAHAVFFEFQRQVSDLRREASRTGQAIRILDPAAQDVLGSNGEARAQPLTDDELDVAERVLTLRGGWTYSLAPALEIEEGGRCGSVSANLVNQGEVIMSLRTNDGSCRFARYVTQSAG